MKGGNYVIPALLFANREFAECLHDVQKHSLGELLNFFPVKLNFCLNDLPACICF